MSRKECMRGAVLARVAAGTMTLADAVPLLGVSYRQAKRLWRRYRGDGSAGLVHGNVGRRSNRALDAATRAAVVGLIRAHYGGTSAKGPGQRFGPTLVAEHLWTDHGLLIARSTLRDWMREDGLWSRTRRGEPRHTRRERRPHFGELVQLDGSFHDWFEGRGPRAGQRSCMMSLVDDATSTTLVRFGAEQTIWPGVAVLRAWLAAAGGPGAPHQSWENRCHARPKPNATAVGAAIPNAGGGRAVRLRRRPLMVEVWHESRI